MAKMKFSKNWWTKYQKDRGITWRRICGNRITYTCGEVEKERERVRAIIRAYGKRNTSNIDESSFTGEPNPVAKAKDSQVWTGTLNGDGALTIKVVSTGKLSALGGIIEAVLKTQEQETKAEQLTDRISKIFVPSILVLSLLTGMFWFYFGEPLWFEFAINVLRKHGKR